MPSREALDAMTKDTLGVPWSEVTNPEWRIKIMTLAIASEHNQILDAIEGHLTTTNEHLTLTVGHLDTLTDQVEPLAKWFESSKLWEGDVYVTNR